MLTDIPPGQLLAASPMHRTGHVDLIAVLQNWCEANAPNLSWIVWCAKILLSHLGEADVVLFDPMVPSLIPIVADVKSLSSLR